MLANAGYSTTIQSQVAVTTDLKSQQLLLLGFALQDSCGEGRFFLAYTYNWEGSVLFTVVRY